MYRWWGIGLIGAGLAIIVAFFGEAMHSPAAIPRTEPIVMLPSEPTPGWPRPLLEVNSLSLEETETRREVDEEVETIVLLPPRRPSGRASGRSLASTPLPENQETTQPDSSLSRLTFRSASPLLGWPVNSGGITQGFGCSPYYTGLTGSGCPVETPWFHDGLDIRTAAGTGVRAAITGTVLFAGSDSSGPECSSYHGYGLAVVVDNGMGWQVLYAHLSQVQVFAGQTVTPETLIGRVGATGCVSGTHLHFGLRHNGELVDPAEIGSRK